MIETKNFIDTPYEKIFNKIAFDELYMHIVNATVSEKLMSLAGTTELAQMPIDDIYYMIEDEMAQADQKEMIEYFKEHNLVPNDIKDKKVEGIIKDTVYLLVNNDFQKANDKQMYCIVNAISKYNLLNEDTKNISFEKIKEKLNTYGQELNFSENDFRILNRDLENQYHELIRNIAYVSDIKNKDEINNIAAINLYKIFTPKEMYTWACDIEFKNNKQLENTI